MYQIRNLIGRSNVTTKAKHDMNACEDFLNLVLSSYVTSAAMQVLGITDLQENPSCLPSDLWLHDKDERAKAMDKILSEIVDRFLDVSYNESAASWIDCIFTYAKQLISIGSLYLELTDAVKEGDGERVIRYFLIIFHNANRKNYAKESILLLYSYQYLLTPQQAQQLLYSRFVNTSGKPGRNISADLHMEHLNGDAKSCIAALQSNKSEEAIIRIGKAITMKKDVLQVVHHINKCNILADIPGRKFPTFTNIISMLHKTSETELISWIKTHTCVLT